MYYREFGIPARIDKCCTVEELEANVKKYNGKKNCYASVYVFDEDAETEKGRTNYESALINTLWFDFDHNKDVEKCLKDVRKFIRRFCNPLKITPRIYLTGGKGFQMNIDFHSPVDLPAHIKRQAIQKYLVFLKKKYYLNTLDDICIKNSVSCMRRIVNTAYISKIEGRPTGVWCTQFTVDAIMSNDIAALYAMAMEDTGGVLPPVKSKKAQRKFVEFICDEYDIKHTVSNSIEHLLRKIKKETGESSHWYSAVSTNIKPPRKRVLELIESNIKRGYSSHEENKIIAFELINAGWSNRDISFVFQSIYNEPADGIGWYSNDPNKAGSNIVALRAKGINRYSDDKLQELKVRVTVDK
jgi:hypothetical protein